MKMDLFRVTVIFSLIFAVITIRVSLESLIEHQFFWFLYDFYVFIGFMVIAMHAEERHQYWERIEHE
jgi:hypothetical protein